MGAVQSCDPSPWTNKTPGMCGMTGRSAEFATRLGYLIRRCCLLRAMKKRVVSLFQVQIFIDVSIDVIACSPITTATAYTPPLVLNLVEIYT